ncbi:MAG: anti-sigma factor, partial [Anaerolineae bacterium]|nr:anti-sigma factor [Anaerolineae bacterium]
LMAAVAARQVSTPSLISPMSASVPKASRRWLTPTLARLALAAAALLLVINMVLIARLFNLSDEQQQQETKINELSDQLTRQNQFFAALATGKASRINLESSTGEALASVIWTPASNSALLVSNNLPALASNRAYQLWFIRDNQPISGGVFRVDEEGQGTFIFEIPAPLNEYDALGISDEPMTGSETPSTNPVALGGA